MNSDHNEIESALDAGRQLGSGGFLKVPGYSRPLVFKHKDMEAVDSHEYLVPHDYRSNARFDDLDSFISYVNMYRCPGAHVFAQISPSQISLRAVLSYIDRDGGDPDGTPVDVRREATLAHFSAIESQQLKAWRSKDGVSMSQIDMSEWLDTRARDIAFPPAADVLELIQNFESKRDVHFKTSIRLSDGTVSLAYEDKEKSTKSQIEFPSEITLSLPLFRHLPPIEIKVKLRYRVNDGNLRLSYHLQDLESIFDLHIKEAVDRVETATTIPVYLGDLAAMPELFKTEF